MIGSQGYVTGGIYRDMVGELHSKPIATFQLKCLSVAKVTQQPKCTIIMK